MKKKEKDILDNYGDFLGIDDEDVGSTTMDEKLRIVALKRKFNNKILKPLKFREGGFRMYTFPYDIWHVISKYLETLSVLKLEKACIGLYHLFNEQCNKCDSKSLRLHEDCNHTWRFHY